MLAHVLLVGTCIARINVDSTIAFSHFSFIVDKAFVACGNASTVMLSGLTPGPERDSLKKGYRSCTVHAEDDHEEKNETSVPCLDWNQIKQLRVEAVRLHPYLNAPKTGPPGLRK